MKYKLTLNGNDPKEFDNVDGAKAFVDQVLIALQKNVELHCALYVHATSWNPITDKKEQRIITYKEREHERIYDWVLEEESYFK